ncbi:SAG-related sequence SRS19D [Toxoplasma gondii VEG]|uniref:SRS19D n=2 Tax=Toxoplasma gondii TaxID=5811 RepID=B9QQ20_TOXGV|nr:SAG-related sequence SRS19D [Toxoplasma gondii VEG]CEL72657.1 TPA: SRS19D [Toxoplasma gondii VEG]
MARTQMTRRLGGGFRPRASKLMAICLGGIALFSTGEAVPDKFLEGLQTRSLQQSSIQTGPTFGDGVATCELKSVAEQAAAASTNALILSKGKLTAKLVCSGDGNAAVPESLTTVCKPGRADGTEKCKFGTATVSEGIEAELKSLLGVNSDVKWEMISTSETDNQGQTWTLTLNEGDLPFKDTPFFVGCKKTAKGKAGASGASPDSCKVPVHVEARASAEINNVVTCAYGQKSNEEAVQVELTADQRSVTINCGSVGSPMPADPTTQYCEPGDAESGTCKGKNYVDVLPKFEASWVKHDSQKNSVTLTIPDSGFPLENQKIRLACAVKEASETKAHADTATDTFGQKSSICNVSVTVRAGNFASSAISIMNAAANALGAVAVAGVLVGFL